MTKTHAAYQPLMDAWLAEHDPDGRGPGEGLIWSGEFRWENGKPVLVRVQGVPEAACPADDRPAWMIHREALIAGLVGERERLYLTNPAFKHDIDTLAMSYLPSMVDGLAVRAEKEAAEYRKIEMLMRANTAMTPERAKLLLLLECDG